MGQHVAVQAEQATAASEQVVEQVITGHERTRLVKERVLARLSTGGDLALLRKRLPGPGQRPAVLLIHGFGQNRYTWHLQQRSLSAYLAARGYDVFNLELRGHGRSREQGTSAPRVFDEHIDEDMPAALEALRRLGHERILLVGHSLGGAVSYAIAGRYPERVAGVVGISGVFHWGGGTRAMGAFTRILRVTDLLHRSLGLGAGLPIRMDLVGRVIARRLALIESLPVLPTEGWAPGSVEHMVLREWLTTAFDRTSGSILNQMGRWARKKTFCDATGRRDYAAAWAASKVPVLVLAGERDRLAHPVRDVKPAFEASTARDRTFHCFGPSSGSVPYGHVDLLIGRRAPREVWPVLAAWLADHA